MDGKRLTYKALIKDKGLQSGGVVALNVKNRTLFPGTTSSCYVCSACNSSKGTLDQAAFVAKLARQGLRQ